MSRLRKLYDETIRDRLMKEFGYANVNAVVIVP